MPTSSLVEIIENYKKMVEFNPQDARAHHHLAMYYSKQNDYKKARDHFEAAIRAAPNFIEARYHLGLLFFKCCEWDKAQMQFISVLKRDDKHVPAHFYCGALLLQANVLDQAEQHFQAILAINPDHVPTLVNFGALELKRNAGQVAISYFTQALILDENNLEARRNLAATFMHYDRFENALTHYYELQKLNQLELEDIYNMGVAAAALGQLATAMDYYQQVILQQDTHGAALNNLAAIHIRLGQRAEAVSLLERALEVDHQDSASRFMLDVLVNNIQTPAASHEYVRNLFNNYALYYEQHLQKVLQYSLPEQAWKILCSLHVERFQHVLDLGCGTGLSGVLLRDKCAQITGVDLSRKMLTHARNKNIYDAIFETDIISFLQNDSHSYDLIQALDVLPYFGELEELFQAIIPRLTENGLFVLSAEISESASWCIQNNMRFCHHPHYLENLLQAHGLRCVSNSRVIARQENEKDVYETLMVYEKIYLEVN